MTPSEIVVRNPFTNEVVGTVRNMSSSAVRQTVLSCAQADASLLPHERAAVLNRVAHSLEANVESWAELISRESGLSLYDTRLEVSRALEVLEWGRVSAIATRGETWTSDSMPGHGRRMCLSFSDPMPGVALVVTPFNHPLNQVMHKLVPAVAAGAKVVLKPSEKTPLTAVRLVELLNRSGLPEKQIQLLTGNAETVVSTALDCEEITSLAFTGSTEIGRKLSFLAGPRRISLEMGSIDSAIVLDVVDIEKVAHCILRGALANSGQRCTAVKRIIVVDEIADTLVSALADHMEDWVCGDPLDSRTRVGTVIDTSAATSAAAAVNTAQTDGATLLYGGYCRGAQMFPTLVDHCQIGMKLVDREIFAPIAAILRVDSVDRAVAVANAGTYGLSCGVFTQSIEKATFVARRLRSGTVNVNEVPGWRLEVTPFGGIGSSGNGVKEGVSHMTDFFRFTRLMSFDVH